MPTRLLRALVFCAVLSLTLTHAYGQNPKTWVGPNPGNWNTPGYWSPAGVPGTNDDVTIYHPSGDYVYLNNTAPATVDSLTLGGSGPTGTSVLFSNGGQNLTINGLLEINPSGDLELQAGDVITLPNYLNNYGRIHVGPGAQINIYDDLTETVYAGSSYIIQGAFSQNYFSFLSSIQTGAQLYLESGVTWGPEVDSGPFTNSGDFRLDNGTTVYIGGSLSGAVNNGMLETGSLGGGNNHLSVFTTLTNNGYFALQGNGDTAEVFGLTNNGTVYVGTGATLNLDIQPGITDIPVSAIYEIFGTFTQTYYAPNPSAFYDLTTIEGYLALENGQTTDITPGTGTLLNSGNIDVTSGSTLNIHGALTNTYQYSGLAVEGSGTVANLEMLNNNGLTYVGPGATLNLTNQPGGITTVVVGSIFDLFGTFNAFQLTGPPLSGFNSLTDIYGTLTIANGQTIQDFSVSGPQMTLTLHSGGVFSILGGTTFWVHGNFVGMPNGIVMTDPSSLIIDGTLYNYGANITVDGNSVFSVGSVVNGGPLMLTHNAGMTVNNGFYQLASGTLGASIDATGFSIVTVNGGPVVLDGTLDVLLGPNFDPAIGSFYKFLLFGPGELNGTFASIQNEYFNGTEKWVVIYDNAGGYVELEAAPVPEPSTLLLLGSGLIGALRVARRKVNR